MQTMLISAEAGTFEQSYLNQYNLLFAKYLNTANGAGYVYISVTIKVRVVNHKNTTLLFQSTKTNLAGFPKGLS